MKKHDPWIAGGRIPVDKPNPISVAKHYLNLIHREPRLIERDGAFWLDGAPRHLNYVMQETNKLLVQDGKPQIDINPDWRVAEVIPISVSYRKSQPRLSV